MGGLSGEFKRDVFACPGAAAGDHRLPVSSTFQYLVIMGAAVRPDGTPSRSLLRRVAAALDASKAMAAPRFLVSGGSHGDAPSEAAVMRELLLREGVAPERIVMEDRSKNTLSSVRNCAAILKAARDATEVTVCSDRYHLPRCRLLFWACGVRTTYRPMPSAFAHLRLHQWVYYCFREFVAIPVDLLAALLSKK